MESGRLFVVFSTGAQIGRMEKYFLGETPILSLKILEKC